jgi:hypothetical protein
VRRRSAFAPTSLSRTRLELLMGFEPMTSSLPRRCSTTELQQPDRQTNDTSGAGDGDRTHTIGLEGRSSTIELRPPGSERPIRPRRTPAAATFSPVLAGKGAEAMDLRQARQHNSTRVTASHRGGQGRIRTSEASATGLQPVPFDRLGTCPRDTCTRHVTPGASGGIRTHNRPLTKRELCR